MLKDITLGRYYPSCSVLHNLDPRTKILFLIVYTVSVFFATGYVSCAYTAAVLLCLLFISKVPFAYMFRGLKTIAVILVLILLVNDKAFVVILRTVEIVVASNLLALTTKPKDIADALEASLSWLKVFKVPVHDFATMIAIAMRFIPILSDEAQKIMLAQKARGFEINVRNPIKRAKALLPVLVPLFVSAFRRSDELSDAMDSRLYSERSSSRLHPLTIRENDILGFMLIAEYVAVLVLWRVLCL